MTAAYAIAADLYIAAGWPSVVPLPEGKKYPPEKGFTGDEGRMPTPEEIAGWKRTHRNGNAALRLPDGVIGIDVDEYGSKAGGLTLAALEDAWGPLPPTWISSARPLPSGVRFYRIPAGVKLHDKPGGSIEILQRHHRYACVAPSIHPETGTAYRWIAPDGIECLNPPRPEELPELPADWLLALTAAKPARISSNGTVGTTADRGTRSPAVERALAVAVVDMSGGRHDAALIGAMALARLAERGHPGAEDALSDLGRSFRHQVIADNSRSEAGAAKEWEDIEAGAKAKVAASPATTPRWEEKAPTAKKSGSGKTVNPPSEDDEAILAALAEIEGADIEEPGWALLDALAHLLERFVVLPSVTATDAVALWIVHAHAIKDAETTPRLSVQSPEPRCGKTRLLELLELLVPAPLASVSCSVAVLFRSIDEAPRTVLLDEVDAIFSTKGAPEHEDLRALLNAGHRRGAEVQRMVGQGSAMTVKSFKVFAAVVLAGINEPPRTIADRSIVIRMRRRAPGESVERFRRREVAPAARRLAARVSVWAKAHHEVLLDARPDLPEELDDRATDGWEPLLAIADAAGGDWPKRARKAALVLSGGRDDDDVTLGVRLLGETRAVFGDQERVSSADLVARLVALEESPWSVLHKGSPMTPLGLSRLLRHYGIKPKKMKFDKRAIQGYERADFVDSWRRYVPSEPPSHPEPGFDPEPRNPAGQSMFPVGTVEALVPGQKVPLTCEVPGVPGGISDSDRNRVSGEPESGSCEVCSADTLRQIEGVWRHSACEEWMA